VGGEGSSEHTTVCNVKAKVTPKTCCSRPRRKDRYSFNCS